MEPEVLTAKASKHLAKGSKSASLDCMRSFEPKDFFGSVDHAKLLTLVAQRVSDGRVLRLIEAMLTAGSYGEGRLFPTERGTPQGGVASPLLSNILLTPFDREMRRKGYQLMRYADDWVITCTSATEACAVLIAARRVLEKLGVNINPVKT